MKDIKFTTAFLLIVLYSCVQNTVKYKPDPAAVELNNQVMGLVAYMANTDSAAKAIYLLDKATSIDSNYFLGYTNKLMFYYALKQFDKAISTNNKLIQLRPQAHDLYMSGAMLYEQVGDTATSRLYYSKSLAICNVVLDTMDKKHQDFMMMTTNQALNMIMLNDSAKANEILKGLYNSISDDNEYSQVTKEYIRSFMNKSKSEIVEFIKDPVNY